MLQFDFNGFEGFKERFGIQEHGNGSKSRKNKILLAFVKDQFLKKNYQVINFTSMAEMQAHVWQQILTSGAQSDNLPYQINLSNQNEMIPVIIATASKIGTLWKNSNLEISKKSRNWSFRKVCFGIRKKAIIKPINGMRCLSYWTDYQSLTLTKKDCLLKKQSPCTGSLTYI